MMLIYHLPQWFWDEAHRNDPEDMPNKMGMGDAFTSGFSIALCHGNEIDDCEIPGMMFC